MAPEWQHYNSIFFSEGPNRAEDSGIRVGRSPKLGLDGPPGTLKAILKGAA
jgi:hypothetical protein